MFQFCKYILQIAILQVQKINEYFSQCYTGRPINFVAGDFAAVDFAAEDGINYYR